MKRPTPYGYKLRRALLTLIFSLFSIVSLLATYLIATYLPYTANDSRTVTIPSLAGTLLTENDERLPSEWYEVVYDYRSDAASEPGTVLAQQPDGGALRRVIPGRSPCVIRLTLSTGAAQYTLPPMIGKSAHEMLLQLRAQGLIVHIQQKLRNELSPGQVIAVDPPEGTIVREGEVVTLTESQVSTKKTVRVPDVIGTEHALANNALVLRGLRPGEPSYEYSPDIPSGCVISQRPLPGTLVPSGSSASLVISRGGAAEEELEYEGSEGNDVGPF